LHDPSHTSPASLELSVVAPAHNEEDNVGELVGQVGAAIEPLGIAWEFIIVDDASRDATATKVRELMPDRPWLRLIELSKPATGGNGQSVAFKIGFQRARGRLIAVLDADLQNDPGDLPAMLEKLRETGADFVQGDRSHARRDNWVRRQTSRIGRWFRRLIVGDTIRDTGCSLRVMTREIAVRLPLEFKGMHRFIPATARHMGYAVVEMPVNHRPRHAGETKYGSLGITKRAIPGLIDCFAVRYMRNRRRWAEVADDRTGATASGVEVKEAAPAGTEHAG